MRGKVATKFSASKRVLWAQKPERRLDLRNDAGHMENQDWPQ
jgi:hypothetical protein